MMAVVAGPDMRLVFAATMTVQLLEWPTRAARMNQAWMYASAMHVNNSLRGGI